MEVNADFIDVSVQLKTSFLGLFLDVILHLLMKNYCINITCKHNIISIIKNTIKTYLMIIITSQINSIINRMEMGLSLILYHI